MAEAKRHTVKVAQKTNPLYRARKLFLITFTAVVLALLFFLFLIEQFFVVREVKVLTQSPFYSEEEVIAATGVEVGQKMFSFSEEECRLELLRKLSYFSDATVRKVFPSGVEISFEEIPGTMYVDVLGEHYILAPDFSVIARARAEDLAIKTRMHVITDSVVRCVVGEKVVLRDETELDLLKRIYAVLESVELADQVEYLDATNRFHITLNCQGRWEVDLGDSTELEYKAKMLKGVIESATAEYGSEAGGKIDVTAAREAILQLYSDDAAEK
ncbi:MAG: FtsQ-type POTRA domain-containing protein [Clostridia bacterium]|nr:FtsQ-type POTRA domain-containing protein [Clostridia bacterium]